MTCLNLASILYVFGLFVYTIFAHENEPSPVYWSHFNISQTPLFEGKLFVEQSKVEVQPPLQATTSQGVSICGFTLYDVEVNPSKTGERQLPILLSIRDPSGVGDIIIKPNALITEPEYNFQIEAYDCSQPPNRSPKASLRIKVYESPNGAAIPSDSDTDTKGPLVWSQAVYNVRISEQTAVGDSIIQVIARHVAITSNESTPSVSEFICDYSIIAPRDSPFDVDGKGTIRLKSALNAAEHRNYVLRIEAKDCDFPTPSSAVVSVNVEVYHICQAGWQNMPEQVNYVPGTGVRHFAKKAFLDLCKNQSDQQPPKTCHVQNVVATISLKRFENEYDCNLDAASLRHMRKLCNADPNIIELLPSPDKFIQQGMGNVTKLQGVISTPYVFDGVQTRWEVPPNVLPGDHSLGEEFSLSFWMKHLPPTNSDSKEQILCNSDSTMKNRHHYAVFIHNCKLIVLLRREAQNTASTKDATYRPMAPSEWRFQLLRGEICDGKWHHYAISRVVATEFSFGSDSPVIGEPQLRLLVDGRFFLSDMLDNPQVIDDWEMQSLSNENVNGDATRLTVGACWHGAQQQFTQHFKGQLAGLNLLRGRRESDSVFHCINQCQEKLDFHAMNDMSAGMSVSLNSDLSLLMVNGHNVSEVTRLVQKVGYINSRLTPTPGKREIKVTTEIRCREFDRPQLYIADKAVTILVLGNARKYKKLSSHPGIGHIYMKVNQPQLMVKDSSMLDNGLPILETLLIISVKESASLRDTEPESASGSANELLASCLIRADPRLQYPYEYLQWTHKADPLSPTLLPYASNSSYGLLLEGEFPAAQYTAWLKNVHYVHHAHDRVKENYGTGPKSKQKFIITCSQSNGDAISEEIIVTVILPSPIPSQHSVNNQKPIDFHDDSFSHHDTASHGKGALLKAQPQYVSKMSSSKVSNTVGQGSASRGAYLLGGVLVGLVVLVLIAFALVRHNQPSVSVCNFAWLPRWSSTQRHKIHPGIEVVSLPANVENNPGEVERCNTGPYPMPRCYGFNDVAVVNLKVNPMEEIAAKIGLAKSRCAMSEKSNRNSGSYRHCEDDADSLMEGIPPQGMDTLDNYCGSSEDECGEQCLPSTSGNKSHSHTGLKTSPTVLSAGHSFMDSLTASQWSTGSGGRQQQLHSIGRGFNESIRRKLAQLTSSSSANAMTSSAPAGSCFMESPSMEWDDSDMKEQLSTQS